MLTKMESNDSLPTVKLANGDKEWRVNGELHRDNGLPAVESINGCKSWWINGVFQSFRFPDCEKQWWISDEKK